jgi:hypothetical protein
VTKTMNGGARPYIDMTAYEKPEGDAELEARLQGAREAYSNGLNDMLEAVAAQFADEPAVQWVVQDFAMFACFVTAAKMVELSGQPPFRKHFLAAHKYLLKRIERESTEQLIELARVIAGGRALEDGGLDS